MTTFFAVGSAVAVIETTAITKVVTEPIFPLKMPQMRFDFFDLNCTIYTLVLESHSDTVTVCCRVCLLEVSAPKKRRLPHREQRD